MEQISLKSARGYDKRNFITFGSYLSQDCKTNIRESIETVNESTGITLKWYTNVHIFMFVVLFASSEYATFLRMKS